MKIMKKISALVIAMVMVLAMALPAMAADTTIKTPEGNTHTYEIFQIFRGNPTATANELTDLVYGYSSTKTEGNAVSQEDMTTLSGLTDNAAAADQTDISNMSSFVDLNKVYKTIGAQAEEAYKTSVTVPTGYYLIRDKDNTVPDNEAYTLYLMKVVGDELVITPKADKPSSEKHVKDINDSTDTAQSVWKDSADHDIGDEIDYEIIATLPTNEADFAAYEHYYLEFVDTMSKGLTYKTGSASYSINGGTAVALADPTITDYTSDTTDQYTGGKVLSWTFLDIKAAPYSAAAGQTVTIYYKATLNTDAVIGAAGNPNKMHIIYSNNPNNTGDGNSKPDDTNETPDDVNIVFTYQMDVDKVDADYGTLTGAGFSLLKKLAALPSGATTTAYSDDNLASAADGAILAKKVDNETNEYWKVVKAWGVNASGFNFEYKGLDDGIYKIVETTVPAGYNKAADIDFKVTGSHTDGETPALESVTVDTDAVKASTDGATFSFGTETKKHDMTAPSGGIVTAIVNQSGAQLPSTGGIGTTIFYVIGGILVVLAGIVLVTRRKSAE